MSRRGVSLALALTTALAVSAGAARLEGYTDLAPDAWYLPAVAEALDAGAMKGISDTLFAPEGAVTRAQVVQVLYNLEGRPVDRGTNTSFSDVDGQWYVDAARWAASTGLCGDRAGGTFGGDDVVSRAETAQIVADYCEGKGRIHLGSRSTQTVPDYAAVPEQYEWGVGYCFSAEILTGNDKGELNPLGGLTRAEFAQILHNLRAFLAGPPGEKVGATILNCALILVEDSPEAQAVKELSDRLYDATEGRYSIEVFPYGVLGAEADSLEMVRAGDLALAVVSNLTVAEVCPDFAILGAPYVYDSVEHQERAYRSKVLDELFAAPAESGFQVLAAYGGSPYGLCAREPFTTPEALSGKNIRIAQNPDLPEMIEALGGSPVALSFGEVYQALQIGTIDGCESQISTYRSNCLYEVAPYYMPTNHRMVPTELVIGAYALEQMSDQDRAALKSLANESVETAFALAAQQRADALEACERDLCVTVSDIDIQPFRDRLLPLTEEIAHRSQRMWSVYQAIQGLR